MNSVVAVMIVYLGLLAGFAIWSRRETQTLKGFYLAGKKLPYWVVAFSTNATGESGWLLLGLTGMGYAVGAQAYWVVVGEILGIAGSWWLLLEGLVGPVFVVMGDVVAGEAFELSPVPDEGPIEELAPQRPDPTLHVRVRDRRADRRLQDLDALSPEDLVEGGDEHRRAMPTIGR